MSYEIVIGLEVHVQLNTESKVFCGCSTDFGAAPNTQTCPVCLGFPGSLPVLNKKALGLAAKVAIALNCQIAKKIRFDRKNYFYPDLPKNYQISQFGQPLAQNGVLCIWHGNKEKKIRIRRVHLEEDTGKLFHQKDYSLIDFNRSGTPLLEIVSEPDINSPDEAHIYLTSLKAILEYIDVSDCNMEEGSLRCDANISLRESGASGLGVKTEVKNMNSFKGVKLALEYEAKRQSEVLKKGMAVIQETMLYNAQRNITEPMRSKEEAHDYRYFPEPDLVPFDFEENILREIKKNIPELPDEKKARFMRDYKLSDYDAGIMVSDKYMAEYFERCALLYNNPKILANWLMGNISAYIKEHNMSYRDLNLKVEYLSGMLRMIDEGIISGKIAKSLLIDMITTQKDAARLVKEKNLVQITDDKEIEEIIDNVLAENEKSVKDYKAGRTNAITFLIGKVMSMSKGKGNPAKVNEILKKRLAKL